jgi:uncharacterized protein
MDSVDDARLGYPRRSELRTPEGAAVPDTEGGWPPFAVVFALGAGVIALNVVLSLSAQAPGRSGLARLGGPALAIAAAVGAVAVSRRAGRISGGLLALLLGAVVTSVSVGDAGTHLVKVGLSATSYTGLASLVAGVTLVVLGARLLLGAVQGWRRILALPMAAVLIFYLMAPLAVAVYATHAPATPLSGRTPADLGLVYRDVTMRTRDGVLIAGWYLPSRNGAAVVVLHGSGSNRSNMIDHVAVLARHGYGVLAVDARGHGQSGGQPMDLGWFGELDVGAAVSFLSRQPDVDPDRIAALGLSMGGVEALTAAAADPRIRAVVSEGALVGTFTDARSLGLDGWLSLPFFAVRHLAADLLSPAPPPIGLEEAVTRIAPRPVLLISGRDRVETVLNRGYEAGASASSELWELPDTPHAHAIWKHREEWARRVLGFLDRALLSTSSEPQGY